MTVSFVDSATSTSSTVTIPAGASIGDLAVLFDDGSNSSGAPAEVVPTGFTQIGASLSIGGVGGSRSVVSYKILAAGEPGSSITGVNGDLRNQKVILVFHSNLSAFVSATPSTWNGELTSGNPALQTVSASGQAAPLLVLGQAYVTTATPASFSTASPAFDATVGTTNSLLAGYKIYNSSPADHSIDQDDLGSGNTPRSGYVLLVETAAAAAFTPRARTRKRHVPARRVRHQRPTIISGREGARVLPPSSRHRRRKIAGRRRIRPPRSAIFSIQAPPKTLPTKPARRKPPLRIKPPRKRTLRPRAAIFSPQAPQKIVPPKQKARHRKPVARVIRKRSTRLPQEQPAAAAAVFTPKGRGRLRHRAGVRRRQHLRVPPPYLATIWGTSIPIGSTFDKTNSSFALNSVGVPAGALIVILAAENTSSVVDIAVSDDALNDYIPSVSDNAVSNEKTQFFWTIARSAVSTIQVDFAGISGAGYARGFLAAYFIPTVPWVEDVVVQAHRGSSGGAETNPSLTSGTPSRAYDLMFAAYVGLGPSTNAYAENAANGWTSILAKKGTTGGVASTNLTMTLAYQVSGDANARTHAPVVASAFDEQLIMALRIAPEFLAKLRQRARRRINARLARGRSSRRLPQTQPAAAPVFTPRGAFGRRRIVKHLKRRARIIRKIVQAQPVAPVFTPKRFVRPRKKLLAALKLRKTRRRKVLVFIPYVPITGPVPLKPKRRSPKRRKIGLRKPRLPRSIRLTVYPAPIPAPSAFTLPSASSGLQMLFGVVDTVQVSALAGDTIHDGTTTGTTITSTQIGAMIELVSVRKGHWFVAWKAGNWTLA
jgi:hypothetical protein